MANQDKEMFLSAVERATKGRGLHAKAGAAPPRLLTLLPARGGWIGRLVLTVLLGQDLTELQRTKTFNHG